MHFKSMLKQRLLPALFAVGFLAASVPAMAAEGSRLEISQATGTSTQADYVYHGHHYHYHYNGRYYNHRAKKGGHWRYY